MRIEVVDVDFPPIAAVMDGADGVELRPAEEDESRYV